LTRYSAAKQTMSTSSSSKSLVIIQMVRVLYSNVNREVIGDWSDCMTKNRTFQHSQIGLANDLRPAMPQRKHMRSRS